MAAFFAQLKQRRVYRAVAIYVVVAFGFWQAADIAIPALSLPQALMRYIVGGALIGFPIVVALSWLYDLKVTSGVPRPSSRVHRRVATVAMAILIVAATTVGVGFAYRASQLRKANPPSSAKRPVNLELGIESYFAGDLERAAAMLDAVVGDSSNSITRRQDAARYLVRIGSELNDSMNARRAMRRLIDLEPPLALMLPGVESETVMKLYYETRRERLLRAPAAAPAAIGAVEVHDFVEVGELRAKGMGGLGKGVKEFLIGELLRQGSGAFAVIDRSTKGLKHGFDLYRYLESGEGATIKKPSHIIVGSIGVRGDQILLSAWLIDARNGALSRASQALGTADDLFDNLAHLAGEFLEGYHSR